MKKPPDPVSFLLHSPLHRSQKPLSLSLEAFSGFMPSHHIGEDETLQCILNLKGSRIKVKGRFIVIGWQRRNAKDPDARSAYSRVQLMLVTVQSQGGLGLLESVAPIRTCSISFQQRYASLPSFYSFLWRNFCWIFLDSPCMLWLDLKIVCIIATFWAWFWFSALPDSHCHMGQPHASRFVVDLLVPPPISHS